MLSREQPGQLPQITVPVELEKWPPIRSAMAKPKTTRASRMMMMSLICMIVPPAGSRQQSVTLSRCASLNLFKSAAEGIAGPFPAHELERYFQARRGIRAG